MKKRKLGSLKTISTIIKKIENNSESLQNSYEIYILLISRNIKKI